MMGPTHILGGAATWLAGAALFEPRPAVVVGGLAVAVGGSLAPDIDHRRAPAAKLARTAGLAVALAAVAAGLTYAAGGHDWQIWAVAGAMVGLAPWLLRPCGGGFRGVVHSRKGLLAVGLLGGIGWVFGLPLWVPLAFWCGWLSHLGLDAATKEGLRWGYPDKARFGWLPRELSMRTGGRRRKRGKGRRRGRVPLEYKLVQPLLMAACLVAGWAVVAGGHV